MSEGVLAPGASNAGWVAREARERLLRVLADLYEPHGRSPARGQSMSLTPTAPPGFRSWACTAQAGREHTGMKNLSYLALSLPLIVLVVSGGSVLVIHVLHFLLCYFAALLMLLPPLLFCCLLMLLPGFLSLGAGSRSTRCPAPAPLRPSHKMFVLLLGEQQGSHVEAFQRWCVVAQHWNSPASC